MKKSKDEILMEKLKKKKVRNEWIPNTWRYNGSGFEKTRKKELYRKRKHKGLYK